MKRIYIALAATAVAVPASFLAKDIKFSSFKKDKSVEIPMPAIPDSIETGKRNFDKSAYLSARKPADWLHRIESQDWTTILPDTAGVYTLSLRKHDSREVPAAEFFSLASRLRPERFMKGTLVAESSSMIEVFVDGKSQIKKTTADSVPTEAKASISLYPEKAVDIEVHVLALPDDKSLPKFSLRFIPDKDFENVDLLEGPNVTRRFGIENTTLGRRLNSTSISPDGQYVLLNFAETYGEKDSRSWTELRRISTGKNLAPSLPAGCAWMPTGSTLYFTERSGDLHSLYTMPASTLARTLVASDIPVDASSISWAPDASWFAYYDEVQGKKEEGIMKRYTEPDDRIPGTRDRAYLRRYDIATGVSTQLTYGGPTTVLADISPDSKKLLYTANRNIPGEFPFYNNMLIQLDVNTLKTDTLVSKSGSLLSGKYSPDGKQILLWGGPNEFDGIGLNAGDHKWGNDFDIQAYLFDPATRKACALTRDFNPSIQGSPVWNKADGNIYFLGADGFYTYIYSLDPRTDRIRRLPSGVDYIRNFSIGSNEAKYISYTGTSYTTNGQGWMLDLKSSKNTLLADPMGKELSSLNLAKSESWTFTSAKGDLIDGTITLPPDFDPNKKYPLIVYYYGGTTPSTRATTHPYSPQLFASYGYVVYVINPSGTIGYGQEFSARHVNAWGDLTADEIIEGTKKFCKEHPFVDSDKIGCLGASYGGFMTQLLQTKTDIFAAAVSHAGISNVTSYWGEGYWGYSYNAVAAARSYPWSDPDLFTKKGSLFNADKIHTPLLLLHGTRDTNVPIGESIQLFNALKILGRQVEFITVEDQDHIITDYNKRQLWHATIMAWFARYLQNDPRWWDSMYGK